MKTRAIFRRVKVENKSSSFDTIFLKVFYPAREPQNDTERNSGILAPEKSDAPFPVVIFLNGINCPPESYQWLSEFLCKKGFVFATFHWLTDELPGGLQGLTPGIDMRFVSPETYGKSPTGAAIQPILDELEKLNAEGLLKDSLSLDKVILGGHSAGGSIALMNASAKFFPQIKAVFAYAAHTQGSTMLGFPPNTVLPISSEIPVLMLGGKRDGVITWSSRRYGKTAGDAVAPLQETFDKAISGTRGDRFLVILDGANHFSFAHPKDTTTGRPFLDLPSANDAENRALMAELIYEFIETRNLKEQDNKLIAVFERK